MLRELRLFRERKLKKEAMEPGYSIDKRSGEKEALERWENEGGRLVQNHDFVLDPIGEEYRRHKGQVMQIRTRGQRDAISHLKFFLASDKASSITGQTVVIDGERSLPPSVFVPNYLCRLECELVG